MKTDSYTLIASEYLTERIRLLRFSGNTDEIKTAGQFASISIPGFFLRRPFSVFDWDTGWLDLIVERVGQGTEILHSLPVGTILDIMTGLGNGFSLEDAGEHPLLISGGTGFSPMFRLARSLSAMHIFPKIALGFRTAADICCLDRFQNLADNIEVYTDDGSAGIPGRVSDSSLIQHCTKLYACGPLPMLHAICEIADCPAEFAFDVRMGCGFGACMGCSIKTNSGMKRVCKDGPVFRKEELIWEN